MATKQTVRQLKTVFLIFVAFLCCWSPYIVVLLYDTKDSLPLPVHLYTSMLAHLHASLNFTIYGLMNRHMNIGFTSQLLTCCNRVIFTPTSGNDLHNSVYDAQHSLEERAGFSRRVLNRTAGRSFAAVEYHQLQETDGCSINIQHYRPSRRQVSSV